MPRRHGSTPTVSNEGGIGDLESNQSMSNTRMKSIVPNTNFDFMDKYRVCIENILLLMIQNEI